MKRILMKYFIFSIIILCMTSCGNNTKDEFKNGLLCKCVIFPTGSFHETYQINLYEDGNISTIFGTRKTDFSSSLAQNKVIEEIVIDKIEEKITGKINARKLSAIKDYISYYMGEQCFHTESLYIKDSWCVLIETSESISLHAISDFDNNGIKQLYELMRECSPKHIKIHGWS